MRARAAGGIAMAAALLLAAGPGAAAPPRAGDGEVVVWVRFADRGVLEHASGAERERAARAQVSRRSLERRARRGGVSGLLDTDLPVDPRHVRALAARGFAVRAVSRWLNAASVVAPRGRLDEIRRLPFVAEVAPVPRRRVPRGEWEAALVARPGEGCAAGGAALPGEPAFYGYAHAQNRLIRADSLHASGLSGRGVLLAVLDTGFRETHTAFDSLIVIARRDFVHGDTVVANEPGQDRVDQDDHGTSVLSVLAGNWPGRLVGTAFGAEVALAKTEWMDGELPAEMDYWQAGAEWADSLGADVISSSLGYNVFDDPEASYTYADLDGRTTVVTLAAREAARRGITVVTAQGNEGNKPWRYLLAPADADSACAVGAVDSTNLIAVFSSFGPTADGRVKPDVCAMGRAVKTARPGDDTGIYARDGTSLATPALAGLVAMLLEAHPDWGPFEVLEALRSTADRSLSPDAQYGYGTARGELAADWLPSTLDSGAGRAAAAGLAVLGPNPALSTAVALRVRLGGAGGRVAVDVFDVRGRRIRELLRSTLPAASAGLLFWNGDDDSGRRVPGGVYFVRLHAPGLRQARRVVILP